MADKKEDTKETKKNKDGLVPGQEVDFATVKRIEKERKK